MSRIAPAIMMVIALSIAVANAQDQFLQAPVYHVGDTWKIVYPHKDNDAREFTVTEVSEKGVTMSDNGQMVSYDKDGNRTEGPSGGPGAKWLSFPIQVGRKWSFEFQGGGNTYTIEAKVAKITTVTTKAGTFEAAQIESCWDRKGAKFYECGFKIWYAPAVKRIVKREAPNAWANGRWANDNFELLSYKLVNN